MARNQFAFYATKTDLLGVLRDVNTKIPYIFSCIQKNGRAKVYSCVDEIPDSGSIDIAEQSLSTSYLLIREGEEPVVRTQQRSDGSLEFLSDQLSN